MFYYKLDNVHSLAQRTNQETSTPTKASPYMGRMQKENRRNRRFSLGFGIAGHAMGVYAAAIESRRKEESSEGGEEVVEEFGLFLWIILVMGEDFAPEGDELGDF